MVRNNAAAVTFAVIDVAAVLLINASVTHLLPLSAAEAITGALVAVPAGATAYLAGNVLGDLQRTLPERLSGRRTSAAALAAARS